MSLTLSQLSYLGRRIYKQAFACMGYGMFKPYSSKYVFLKSFLRFKVFLQFSSFSLFPLKFSTKRLYKVEDTYPPTRTSFTSFTSSSCGLPKQQQFHHHHHHRRRRFLNNNNNTFIPPTNVVVVVNLLSPVIIIIRTTLLLTPPTRIKRMMMMMIQRRRFK